MNPNQVCQSSAINFSKFAVKIENLYNESRDSINDEFFKKSVCSVIIFDQLDRIISKADWYPRGGNKAQIVPYTISKMFTLIPKGMDIDWRTIWQKQSITPEMVEELERLAFFTHVYLEKTANGGIVRSISRTIDTWKYFQDEPFELSNKFVKSLVSLEERKADEGQAKRASRFNHQIDDSVQIFKLGYSYWMKVYTELSKENVLNWSELDFIQSIAKYIDKANLPTSAQCKRLMKIIAKAEDFGYIMPE